MGGLETVVVTLARHRAASAPTFAALILTEDDDQHPVCVALREAGVTTEIIAIPGRQYGVERRRVVQTCRKFGIGVVHTHGYRPDVVDASAARSEGLATVTTVHGFTGNTLRNRFYEWLQTRAFRRFDAVVAVSRPLGALLERRGVPSAVLHVIPNAYRPAVAPLGRLEARAALGILPHTMAIGWVGRLSPEKGADVFLDALALVPDERVTAVVLGDGREHAALLAHATRLGLGERVRWLGNVPNAGRLFPAFDLFVLSSRTEGTPMSLLEAIVAEVPIVATAVGGVPDVISSREGWLVGNEDPHALAAAMREVLTKPEEAASRAAAAAERFLRELNLERWLARYEEIYQSIRE